MSAARQRRTGTNIEDASSDLYVLCLIAAELATGRPVYDGKLGDVLDAASAGDAPALLGAVPAELAAVLKPALAPFVDQRPKDPRATVERAKAALARASGRTLADLVAEASRYLSDVEEEFSPSRLETYTSEVKGLLPKSACADLDEAFEQLALAQASIRKAASRLGYARLIDGLHL